jgi:formate dehydrogenase maturation protein FdhE
LAVAREERMTETGARKSSAVATSVCPVCGIEHTRSVGRQWAEKAQGQYVRCKKCHADNGAAYYKATIERVRAWIMKTYGPDDGEALCWELL